MSRAFNILLVLLVSIWIQAAYSCDENYIQKPLLDVDQLAFKPRNIDLLNNILYRAGLRKVPFEFEKFDKQKLKKYFNVLVNNQSDFKLDKSLESKLAFLSFHDKYSQSSLVLELSNLNYAEQKRIIKLLRMLDNSSISQKSTDYIVHRFYTLLRGELYTFKKSFRRLLGDSFKSDEIQRLIQENVLRKGLDDYFKDKNLKTKTSYNKVKLLLKKNDWLMVLIDPGYLPQMSKLRLPDDLLSRVLSDGLEQTKQDIEVFYQKKKIKRGYHSFRAAWIPIISVAFFTYMGVEAVEALPNSEKVLTAISIQNQELESLVNNIDDIKTRELYERSVEKFIKVYGSEPSELDKKQLLARVKREISRLENSKY